MGDNGSSINDLLVSSASQQRIALLAQRAERARLAEVASLPWVDTREGDGWLAVRSHVDNNDLNGVISDQGVVPGQATLAEVSRWLGSVPATWYATCPNSELTEALVAAGWEPERTGRCAGSTLPLRSKGIAAGVSVLPVEDDSDRQTWLNIARACDWFDDTPGQRSLRERLARDLTWQRWLATLDGTVVGMATGWLDGDLLELVDIAVVEPARRRGVGTALLAEVCTWGKDADHIVAAPSPDGWMLLQTHGFVNVPTTSDTAFYRSGPQLGNL